MNVGVMSVVGQLLMLTSIFFINFMSRITFAPLMPQIEASLGLDHAAAGSFFLVISSGYFFGLLGSGVLSSRITHRGTIIVSPFVVGIALVWISLSRDLWTIRIALLAVGIGAGIYLPSGIATLTSLVEQPHWGKALAVHELAPNVSFVAAPLLAEAMMGWFSWKGVMLLLGVSCMVLGTAFACVGKGGRFYGEAPGIAAAKGLLRERAFWIMVVLFSLGASTTLGVYTMLPLFLVTGRGMEQGWANSLVGFSRVSGIFMAMVSGVFNDRLGPRSTLFTVLVATGIITIFLGVLNRPWTSVMVFLQPVVAVCFFPPGFAALSSLVPPNSRNSAVSFTVPLAIFGGGGLIPVMIGMFGDMGTFGTGIAITGCLTLAGAFFTFLLKR